MIFSRPQHTFLRATCNSLAPALLCAAAVLAAPASAYAATLCVNTHASSGCHTTINAAVAAASAGDTINVAPGTYREDVLIGKPLSLVGSGPERTTIDAAGLSNGIYVDGLHNPGLAHVSITGFTIRNANFEGVLLQSVAYATFWSNEVRGNDLGLNPSAASCLGLPAFETNEPDDCGEGVHLMGVNHSAIYNNDIEHNAGGILVTDETAPTFSNVINGNRIQHNAYDCGVTLASHPPYGAPEPFGVYENTVSSNDVSYNGLGGEGGAGVGVYAAAFRFKAYGNVVINNRLVGNGLPGVALHTHASIPQPNNPVLADNQIIGNYIAENGPDSDLGVTVPIGISILGVYPVTGTVITGNTIRREDIDIALETPSLVDLHLNDLGGGKIGVENLTPGATINATDNWWGCSGGPGAGGCSTVQGPGIVDTPRLTSPLSDDHD